MRLANARQRNVLEYDFPELAHRDGLVSFSLYS
jgi:hypothetical protein